MFNPVHMITCHFYKHNIVYLIQYNIYNNMGARCSVVVEALPYKAEGLGFETR
jgi:hypothetical protein